jgi:hypothetical protein
MMKVSVEGESMAELLANIELLLLEFDGLDDDPEADPLPVLEQYDLTWGKMWELADRYEASGRLFTTLLVSHTGQDSLRETPIGSWASIANEANEKLKRDAVVKDLR